MKQELEQLLLASLQKLVGGLLSEMPDAASVSVERTRDAQHGEFATNLALRLAKAARKSPRELAAAIVAALPANPLVARAEVAGAGFINFHLTAQAYQRELASIHARAGAVRREHPRCRRAGTGRVRLGQPHRPAARRPRPPGRLRRDPCQHPAGGGLSTPSASTTSTMPAGRWTSSPSAPGCVIWRSAARCCPFRRTAIAVTMCARWRSSCRRQPGEALRRSAAERARGPAGRCAGRRQGGVYRCADRALRAS